jgi:hypothetical protein
VITCSAVPPRVNGRAFLGAIRFLSEQRARHRLPELIERASPELAQVFASRIGKLGWYPYPTFVEILERLEEMFGTTDGSTARALGTSAGKVDLGSMFRVYRAVASSERLIRGCSNVWPRYYEGAGRMVAETWEPDDTRVRIYDFPEMHVLHSRLMEGWMISTMRVLGFVCEDARQTAFMGRGDAYHEYACRWSRK